MTHPTPNNPSKKLSGNPSKKLSGAGLTPERRALLARMLAEKGVRAAAAGGGERPMLRRADPGRAPLTFAQEALWFLDQLEPNLALHNQPGAVRLAGALDVEALRRSLAEIVRRHEPLRTTFATEDGRPTQVIAAPGEFEVPLTDLTGRGREAAMEQALRLATEEAHRPMDLERGPLFRSFLVRVAPTEHVLVLNMHHIVTDGWSMGVFTRELRELYTAYLAGRPSPLPELAIQLGDFAAWQRAEMQGERLAEHLGYWRENLAGNPTGVVVAGDRPRPAVQSFRGGHQTVTLDAELSNALRALARQSGVTPFVTLLAAFDVLLHARTQACDMVLGSAVAHRNRAELEALIGFLVNMLVLRTDLSGNPSFSELQKRVQRTVLGAWQHQDLPMNSILAEVQPGRDLSKNPLFQVQFSLLTPDVNPAVYGYGLALGDVERVELPGLEMTPLHVQYDNARYDVAVFLWDMPSGIRGTIEYASDLYEPATMARFAARYESVLRAVVARPEAVLSELAAAVQAADEAERATAEASFEQSLKKRLGGLKPR